MPELMKPATQNDKNVYDNLYYHSTRKARDKKKLKEKKRLGYRGSKKNINLLFSLLLFFSVQAQPCTTHTDCTATTPCTFKQCVNRVCVTAACQDILLDCELYTDECYNRRCVHSTICCCLTLAMNYEQRLRYIQREHRDLNMRVAEENKPKLSKDRFLRRL